MPSRTLGSCKHTLQYDEWSDGSFGVRVVTWNVGSLSGNGGLVCEELRKRMIDVCCFQEVRWRGQGARMLGIKGMRYRMWWYGKGDEVDGLGVMVKNELCEKVVEVKSMNDRVTTVIF